MDTTPFLWLGISGIPFLIYGIYIMIKSLSEVGDL